MAFQKKNEKDDIKGNGDGNKLYEESRISDTSTETDSSVPSDSDDSSELDEQECEQRRRECLQSLANLRRQFRTLRQQLYTERMAELHAKITGIRNGTAQEYLDRLEELKVNNDALIELAENRKRIKMESIEHTYNAEELAARQDYENDKQLVFDSMRRHYEERIRQTEEDMEVVATIASESDAGPSQPVRVQGPHIVYQLTEEEIEEDLNEINKAIIAKQNRD